MARQRFLRNAPIQEALIDFRANATRNLGDRELAQLKTLVGAKYPTAKSINRLEVTFEEKQGEFAAAERIPTHVGWMFRTPDGRQVAQFRGDGFTFNRLPPYSRWEELFPQALELWEQYVKVAAPAQVGRLAVRFINRLQKLEPVESFGLTVPPRVPPELPFRLRSYLSRQVVDDEDQLTSANIVQTVEEAFSGPGPTLLLDIDAFWEGSVEPNDERIGEMFGRLRELKNRIFFASITEETARLYE